MPLMRVLDSILAKVRDYSAWAALFASWVRIISHFRLTHQVEFRVLAGEYALHSEAFID